MPFEVRQPRLSWGRKGCRFSACSHHSVLCDPQ